MLLITMFNSNGPNTEPFGMTDIMFHYSFKPLCFSTVLY